VGAPPDVRGRAAVGRRVGSGHVAGGVIHNLTSVFGAPGNRSQRLGGIGVREFAWPHLRALASRVDRLALERQHAEDVSTEIADAPDQSSLTFTFQ
jgi:hypothetical protein